MIQARFSAVQRGAKAAMIAIGALLTFLVVWRIMAIILSDIASYTWRH